MTDAEALALLNEHLQVLGGGEPSAAIAVAPASDASEPTPMGYEAMDRLVAAINIATWIGENAAESHVASLGRRSKRALLAAIAHPDDVAARAVQTRGALMGVLAESVRSTSTRTVTVTGGDTLDASGARDAVHVS